MSAFLVWLSVTKPIANALAWTSFQMVKPGRYMVQVHVTSLVEYLNKIAQAVGDREERETFTLVTPVAVELICTPDFGMRLRDASEGFTILSLLHV